MISIYKPPEIQRKFLVSLRENDIRIIEVAIVDVKRKEDGDTDFV